MAASRRSPHEARQKRQMRHAGMSGEDMPPLGFMEQEEDGGQNEGEMGYANEEMAIDTTIRSQQHHK